MDLSATNAENKIIPVGAAIAYSGSVFRLANSSRLATHISISGSLPRGVVIGSDSGSVEMSNWSVVTGSKLLTAGKEYFVGDGGKLKLSSYGQSVGFSVSATQLSIAISTLATKPYEIVTPSPKSTSRAITAGAGRPTMADGESGEYRLDPYRGTVYGPKTEYGWGLGRRLSGSVGGSFALAMGVSSGSSPTLSLPSTPSMAMLTVEKPAGGLSLIANPVSGTLLRSGFDFELSATTDSANYVLHYQIFF